MRYRKAGLVAIGKGNTGEFGLSPTCKPTVSGPTRKPWILAARPGGQRRSAAAVAAGLVPMGQRLVREIDPGRRHQRAGSA